MLGNAKVDPGQVFSAAWKNDTEFATSGIKHMKIFTMSGANLNGKKGSYLQSVGNIAMTCVNYVLNGVLVSGAQDGGLIKWNGTSAAKPIKHHTDAIWSIEKINATSFVTGGNEGKIVFWNQSLAPTKTLDLTDKVKYSPGLRSIDIGNGTMLVGTRGADVVEMNMEGDV